MKTLYLTASSTNIAVDTENNEVTRLDSVDRYDIRQVFYMEEPMHVVYEYGEKHEEIDAKKGDLVFVFYDNKFAKHILTSVKCKAWVDNIKNKQKMEQKAKEEWAAKHAAGEPSDPCCDCAKCECAG